MTTCNTARSRSRRAAGLQALLATPVVLLALTASVNADALFSAPKAFGTGVFPHSVAIADVNVDGRPDLAVANGGTGSGTVIGPASVLLGNGDGTFGSRMDFGAGNYPLSLMIADLNADGHPDLIVGNGFASTVSVLLGNGDGTFRARAEFPTRDYPTSVAIADLNADGKLDLVVANLGDPYADHSTVSVLLGNGDGTFGTRREFGTGGGPRSVSIADLDADGRPDLAVANNWIGGVAGTVSILLGNGDGTFRSKTDFGTADYPQAIAIADLDADGHRDLAVSTWSDVSVLLGNGDGTFGASANFGIGAGLRSIAIADLDTDGRQDIAVTNTSSNTVSVLLHRTPPAPLAMEFDFTPGTLNLTSRGRWVTGFLVPAPPLAAGDIDVSSIRLNGTVPVDAAAATALGDHDGDGVPDLMVKFDRVAVELTVSEGESVPVTVTGTLDDHPFSGADSIRVRRGRISSPHAGSQLAGGALAWVRWETPNGVAVESVRLLFSPDGGGTWSPIARGQPNTGSYDWMVPGVPSDQARMAVVAESADRSTMEGVLGVSDAFAIGATVGVDVPTPGQVALAIRGVTPNPAVGGRLRVEFALRDGSPARLELMDVAGRLLHSRDVGSFGPGTHALDLSAGRVLRPGMYFLRLTQGGREARTRATVLR